MKDSNLREQLAAIEHKRWSDWQEWMHTKGTWIQLPDMHGNPPKSYLAFPSEYIAHLNQQIETPYDGLSEKEQASDMEQVNRYWPLITEVIEAKDNAYYERDQLVAALSKLYPAWFGWHEGKWEDDWRTIVYIKLPTGQVSWHIHKSEIPNFKHLEGAEYLGEWDGHTTEEKYRRLAKLSGVMR